MNVKSMHWAKQAYLCSILSYPIGYTLIHAVRDDTKFTKLYVDRLQQEPPDHLTEIFESELLKVNMKRTFHVKLTMTDELEPRTYGSFLLKHGAEIQLPIRMAFQDVEGARELGKALELDMGLPSSRRKVDTNSELADEMLTRMVLSPAAKQFAIQREVLRAQSGTTFLTQPAIWVVIVGMGYAAVAFMSPMLGPMAASAITFGGAVEMFRIANKSSRSSLEKRLDRETIDMGQSYIDGARDYLKSSMRLGRFLRKKMGDGGVAMFSEIGDCLKSDVKYSTRLSEIESYLRQKDGKPLRRRRGKQPEVEFDDLSSD